MVNHKGITLMTVVINIIILLILAGISINTLFGTNGIITMALRVKSEYEVAAKNEQKKLAGLFGRNYVDYNGELRVEGRQLVNQYGENIQLRGFSTSNGDIANFDFTYYYNETSIATVKSCGANLIRLLVLPKHYIKSDEVLNQVYEIIDDCIEQNMYIIVDWHVIKEGDPNIYKEYAISFFNSIAKKYKDIPNILYEICNEPNKRYAGYEVNWDMIANYANEVIPVIRKYSKDSIIIVGTPECCIMIEDVIGKQLNYQNIMYTLHMYPATNYSIIDKLKLAMENNLAIFVTEWSCYNSEKNVVDDVIGNEFIKAMDYYRISWVYFELGDDENITEASVVKEGMWNNTLQDSILTESGKYIKDVFIDIVMETGNAMMKYEENKAFWNEEYRNNITSIHFKNEIDKDVIDQSIIHWDVSYVSGSNKVIAYLLDDGLNNDSYQLEIASNNYIIAPKNAEYLFSNFENLKEINFENLKTDYTYNMNYMLANNPKLVSINLSDIDTSNVRGMGLLFSNCSELQMIDVSNLNTTSVTDMTGMFSGCLNLRELNLANFDTANVTKFNKLFYNCRNLKQLDLSNFNTELATEMNGMFQNCTALEKIDISNFNMDKIIDMSYMFAWSPCIQNINMENVDFSNVNNNSNNIFKGQTDTISITVKNDVAGNFIKELLNESNVNGRIVYSK